MTPMFDVFRLEDDGVLWLESAATFACAKARVEELAAGSPGVFLIVDQNMGDKHVINLDGAKRRNTAAER